MAVQLVECRHGRFLVLENDEYVGRCLEKYGEYSEDEVRVFSEIVRPGDTVVEAGANIGAHTIPLSKLVGPTGNVLAFEPQPHIFHLLCGNLGLNGCYNVDAYPMAIGEEGDHRLLPKIDYESEFNFGGVALSDRGERMVSVASLDRLNLKSLRLLKADVEGMEIGVLLGARDTIMRCRPYLYIEDDRPLNTDPLRALIAEMGYEIKEHKPDLVTQDNYRNCRDNLFDGYRLISLNLLCIPM